MAETTSLQSPPMEIFLEYLRRLKGTATQGDPTLVLRGSLLLRCWFGNVARPAADIDLECFEGLRDPVTPRFAGSPVAHARALCVYATESWHLGSNASSIEFEAVAPEDGTDLWDYATPGLRCYTLWVEHNRDARGRLQIDLAQSGSYDLDAISAEEVELSAAGNPPFRFLAYTPEMLLAAKLSWLLRSLKPTAPPDGTLRWHGQPKDLFDAHLLLTKGNLRTDELQKGLYAVGVEDKLDWLDLSYFLETVTAISDSEFANWEAFRVSHEGLLDCGPAEMLRTITERLKPLLGDFRDHVPFLRAIHAEPNDPLHYLIYADWLESRSDPRADLLRLYSSYAFSPVKPTLLSGASSLLTRLFQKQEGSSPARKALLAAVRKTPTAWLYQVFGGPERFRRLKQKLKEAEGTA